jgi:hypothetical protein
MRYLTREDSGTRHGSRRALASGPLRPPRMPRSNRKNGGVTHNSPACAGTVSAVESAPVLHFAVPSANNTFRNGTPAARPVRKASGLPETAGLPKRIESAIAGSVPITEETMSRSVSTLALLASPSRAATSAGRCWTLSLSGGGEGAQVWTDKEEYQPGDTVKITEAGWWPGEVVHIHFTENPKNHPDHNYHVESDEEGRFIHAELAVEEDHLGVHFTFTATGQESGYGAPRRARRKTRI